MKIKTKIKRNLSKAAKEHKVLRKPIRFFMNAYRLLKYKINTFYIKTDDKTIIFASFAGKGMTDNPKALFDYMQSDDFFKDYTFVWGLKEPYKGDGCITVKYGSRQWLRYLAKAKYWVFNFKIADAIKPKRNQIFLQCWHGTPLKRLGLDLKHYDGALNTAKEMQKRYKKEAKKIDYLIAQSPYAAEKFSSAWNLKKTKILEEGYPRNDSLFCEYDVQSLKEKIIGKKDKRKIILYAPTYRADQHKLGVGYTYKTTIDFDKLRSKIGRKYILLFRSHYFIANSFDFEDYRDFIWNVSDYENINELYVLSDVLITDYSSVMFDYSILKKKMIFYMYDLDHYRNESNGFYFDINELPGIIAKTEDELIDAINIEFTYGKKYRQFNEKFNPLDDGNASQRIIEGVWY